MSTIVKIGNKRLIETVSVLTTETVRIELAPTLIIEFEFKENDEKKIDISWNVVDGVLKISLFNFSNSLGTSTKESLKIGTYQGHPLYIHFGVHAMGDSVKMLTCSFFEELANG